jgi:hypothetical protein
MRAPRIRIVIDEVTGTAPGLTRHTLEAALVAEVAATAERGTVFPGSTSRARARATVEGKPTPASIAAATLKGVTS